MIAARPAAAWAALAAEHDLPLEPVRSAAEAAADPRAETSGVLTTKAGTPPRLAFPARFDGARPRAAPDTAEIGADTDRLLAELGIDLPAHRRRAAGVGRRLGLRRLLARWWSAVRSRRR